MADVATETTETTQAPTTAPVTEQPKATEKPKDVTLEKAIEEFGDTFTYGLGKKKKAEKPSPPEQPIKPESDEKNKKDAKDGKDKATEEAAEKPKEEEPPRKPKPKPKVSEPPLSESRLAEIAADAGGRAASAAITQIQTAAAKVEKEKETEDFKPPKEYADQYQTFKVMAKSKPDQYGKLPDEFKTFVKEEETYIKTWKREHPGETWNGEADEHNDFYQRATPTYDDKDFRKAEYAVELADARKELRKEVLDELDPRLKKLDEMERNETLRSLQPTVAVAERTAMGTILKAIDPDYEKFVEPEALVKLKEQDEDHFEIAIEVAKDALPFVAEVTRLWNSKGAIKADNNNLAHKYIFTYATQIGEAIKALPADDQMRDGKKFATWDEFGQMTATQQAKHWTLSDQDLIARKLLDAQAIAKERTDFINKKRDAWAKRMGGTPGNAQNPPPKPAAPKPEPPAKPLPVKENNGSPSVGSRTQVSPNSEPAPSSEPDYLKQFASVFAGRSL